VAGLIAAVTVAALVAGSVAALSVNQKLRRDGPVARSIKFERVGPGRPGGRPVRVSFRLTETDTVAVEVVDEAGSLTRVLSPPRRLEGDDTRHRFRWRQDTEQGEPAEPGPYRLRLRLEDADRVATSGERFVVKTTQEGP
jgi:hypothetical protein